MILLLFLNILYRIDRTDEIVADNVHVSGEQPVLYME